jgi:hypothetical protein
MKIRYFLLALILSGCSSNKQIYQPATYTIFKSSFDKKVGNEYYRNKVVIIDSTSFDVTMILDSSIRDGYKHIPSTNDSIKYDRKDQNRFKYSINLTKNPKLIQYSYFDGNQDSTNSFNFFDKKSYTFGTKEYKIFCVGHLGFETDGDFLLFLNNQFGLLATYSTSWGNLSLLDKTNYTRSADLNQLIEKLKRDSTFFPRPKNLNFDSIVSLDRHIYYSTWEDNMLKSLKVK